MLKNTRIEIPLKPRSAKVIRIMDISPTLRRVRLQGSELEGFGFHPLAPEAHVKLFFPQSPNHLRMPNVMENGSADWQGAKEGRFSPFRDYTIRAFDKHTCTLDIDFVLHDEGVGGPWAKQAKVGDVLGIFGPRSVKLPPTNAANYVFFVDETSLPAFARWLEILPNDAHIDAWIEVASADSEIPLSHGDNTKLNWLYRDSDGGQPYGALLYHAVETLPILSLSDATWLWAATEAHVIAQMKRRLMTLKSLINPAHLDLVAYWKTSS
ncbi:siderophore-interacting protein [Marinomonas aquiplantarum]|uniref:NADPH-dependent ferric siderophore reductase n=1 Tax=Marinomonas aquiplantarum TaxID=491951 RepID=A0A366CTP4_9GAMM|nr:NADPH-dependent ferric siderophore reductase [Marinomonas aquiplantarum]